MIAFLKLIRWPNLFIIALTMMLVRYYIIIPVFVISCGINPELKLNELLHLNKLDFVILIVAAVCIAAAGNIINDFFDREIDHINKPDKNVVGSYFTESQVMLFYWIFNGVGILASIYIAWKHQASIVLLVNLFAAASLYFYSWQFKKTFLLGNLLVSFLSAGIPVLAAFPEKEFYVNFSFVLVYSIFAFLLTWIRELIKDMEDVEGDRAENCKTIPIVLGMNLSRMIAVLLSLGLLSYVVYILYDNFFSNTVFTFGNIITLAIIPFLILVVTVSRAKQKKDYRFLSRYLKFLMLIGILSMIPFYYYFLK